MLTIEEIKKMDRQQINDNWDAVKQVLASARPPITKEEIAAITDPGERKKAIRENLHLWGM